eukprot:95696_1
MAKSFIDVGVLLKQAPSDAVVNALTPDKDKTKRHITKKYEKERARLKAYLASKNTETLPAIQFGFDLWTDKASATTEEKKVKSKCQ